MMKKQHYIKRKKVYLRPKYRFKESETYPVFKQFLAWYELHQSEFNYPLRRVTENSMLIDGVNDKIRVRYDGCELVVYVCWQGWYEEFFYYGASPEPTEHGFINESLYPEWQTVYFSEAALYEFDIFEKLKEWLNEKLPLTRWVAFYKVEHFSFAELVSKRDLEAAEHLPVFKISNQL
jgi:hypothetical protein